MDARAARILERIGHRGPTRPDLEVLRALQHRFLEAVPFENLDIHLGRPIVLDRDAFFAKIVGERRGGFCYECNELFHELLTALGFDVRRVSARMARGPGAFAPAFGHMALIVELDGPVLVDVGNGQSCRDPMRVPGDAVSEAEGLRYRVVPAEGGFDLEVAGADGAFAPRFRFDLEGHALSAFEDQCRFHQTSPLSPFTHQPLATRACAEGRMLLLGRTLRGPAPDAPPRELPDAEAVRDALREHFGLRVPPFAAATGPPAAL